MPELMENVIAGEEFASILDDGGRDSCMHVLKDVKQPIPNQSNLKHAMALAFLSL